LKEYEAARIQEEIDLAEEEERFLEECFGYESYLDDLAYEEELRRMIERELELARYEEEELLNNIYDAYHDYPYEPCEP